MGHRKTKRGTMDPKPTEPIEVRASDFFRDPGDALEKAESQTVVVKDSTGATRLIISPNTETKPSLGE